MKFTKTQIALYVIVFASLAVVAYCHISHPGLYQYADMPSHVFGSGR